MALVPITAAMLAPANQHAAKPRYDAAGAAADWHGGDVGNDVGEAAATQAIANSHSANVETDYHPQHQKERAEEMVPPREILGDIGKDYGEFAGQPWRTGDIEPREAYPDVTSPPAITGLSPATGPAAGGTPVTISGTGFTGATSVTFGGTAATSVTVVSANSITCTSPAHAAGTVDVVVTTPKGTSPTGGGGDNFVYA